MKPDLRKALMFAAMLLSLAMPQVVSALSIYDVIMLSRNGHDPDNIIELIRDTGSAFSLEAMDAVRLKDAGVSDEVVAAMFAAEPAPPPEGVETPEMEPPAPATMADLLLLAEGRISEKVILAFMQTRGIAFQPDAEAVVRLREAGLSDSVLNSMVTMTPVSPQPRQAYVPPPAEAYEPPPQATPYQVEPPRSYVYPEETVYDYPVYYYGPSYFIGFSGIHHSMFRHRYAHAHPYPGHWFFVHNKKKHWHDRRHGDRDHDRDHDRDRDDGDRHVKRIDGGKVYDGDDHGDDDRRTWRSITSREPSPVTGGSIRGSRDDTAGKRSSGSSYERFSTSTSVPDRSSSAYQRFQGTTGDTGWGSGRSSSSGSRSVTGSSSSGDSSSVTRSLGSSRSSAGSSDSGARSSGSSRSISGGSSGASRSSSSGRDWGSLSGSRGRGNGAVSNPNQGSDLFRPR